MDRNMWCTPDMIDAAGRKIYRTASGWIAERLPPANAKSVQLFTFVPARVEVDDAGTTKLKLDTASPNMKVFRLNDAQLYTDAMRDVLRELFRAFPLQ